MPTACHGGLHTGQSRFVRHANLSGTAVGETKQRTLYDVCLPNISHALKVGTFPAWLGFGLGFGLGLASCSCGSIIKGQRAQLHTMAPFSTETRSVGRFWLLHSARSASVQRMLSGSAPCER